MSAWPPVGDLGVLAQETLGVLTPLSDAYRVIAEPGARLLDQPRLDPEIEDLADLRNAFAVHDVELDLLEGRCELVLDHLHARLIADHLVALLDRPDAADIEAHGRVEFQRIAA